MCSLDKLPCKNPAGSEGKVFKDAKYWVSIIAFLLSPLFLPYLLIAFFSFWYYKLFSLKYNFWPTTTVPAPMMQSLPSYQDFYYKFFRLPVYLSCILFFTLSFWMRIIFNPSSVSKVKHISDEELENMVQYSPLSMLLERKKEEEKEGEDIWHLSGCKVQDELVKECKFEGYYNSSFTICFAMNTNDSNNKNKLQLCWITLNGLKIHPGDGLAWEWGKIFALQGVNLRFTYFYHSRMHFKQDILNILVRNNIPENHILFQLLSPHLENNLEINKMVLFGSSSVIQTEKSYLPYNPGPMHHADIGRLLTKHLNNEQFFVSKLDENHELLPPCFMYGRYLRSYYPIFLNFAAEVFKYIDKNDTHIQQLINNLTQFVPEFQLEDEEPDGASEGKTVSDAKFYLLFLMCANFMFCSTVWHTADHYSFGDVLINNTSVIHRIRVSPPTTLSEFDNIDGDLLSGIVDWYSFPFSSPSSFFSSDLILLHPLITFSVVLNKTFILIFCSRFKHYIFLGTFVTFFPSPLRDTSLLYATYPFPKEKQELHKLVKCFKSSLIANEVALSKAGDNLVPLSELLATIEF